MKVDLKVFTNSLVYKNFLVYYACNDSNEEGILELIQDMIYENKLRDTGFMKVVDLQKYPFSIYRKGSIYFFTDLLKKGKVKDIIIKG